MQKEKENGQLLYAEICGWHIILVAELYTTCPAERVLVVLTCLSLCNTQARAVNLIHAILCDDEGVTQARGC